MKTAATIFMWVLCAGMVFPAFSQRPGIAIQNISMYPSPEAERVDHVTILLKDGKIETTGPSHKIRVPSGYQMFDGTGKFAVAGLWNSHVHLMEEKWAQPKTKPGEIEQSLKDMLTSHGFVYAFDLAELSFDHLNEIRDLIRSGSIHGPTIFAVGVPVTSNSPFYILPLKLPELHTAEEVRKHIQTQIDEGADGIKLWSASPAGGEVKYMDPLLVRVAGEITRSRKLPLFAHPTDNRGVKNAVKNGVTVLAHTSPTDLVNWPDSLVKFMSAHHVALIPTLKLCNWELQREKIFEPHHALLKTAQAQLNSYFKAGGTVLFGTDVGYVTDYDPTDEYVLMEASGMRFADILASLTTNPARTFGYGSCRGKIEKGYDADLVILQDDPGKEISNLSKVVMAVHKGEIIFERETDDSGSTSDSRVNN